MIVDTSLLFAFYNKLDPNHDAAVQKLKEIKGPIVISDYVVGEMTTLLLYRKSFEDSLLFIDTVEQSDSFQSIHFSLEDYIQILSVYRTQKYQLSVVDASVVYLAQKFNREALTFDKNIIKEIESRKERTV